MSIFSKLLCFRRRQNRQIQATSRGSLFSRLLDFKRRIYIGRRRPRVVIPVFTAPVPVQTAPYPKSVVELQNYIEKEDKEQQHLNKRIDEPGTLRGFVEQLRAEEPYLADYITDILTKINPSKREFILILIFFSPVLLVPPKS